MTMDLQLKGKTVVVCLPSAESCKVEIPLVQRTQHRYAQIFREEATRAC